MTYGRVFTCDEIVHQCCRNAEDAHQQVTDSQVEDEEVRHRAHMTVFQYNQTHQDVPNHAQQEDEEVGHNVAGSHIERVLIIGGTCNVGDIRETIYAYVCKGFCGG